MQSCSNRHHNQGFTYLGLLIFIALLGLASAATVSVGLVVQRHSAEQELLFIGSQFRDAFRSYHTSTPLGQKPYPTTLEELVNDLRFPEPKRHLRKIYADPITGNTDWELIAHPAGGIMGVSSKSEAAPIQIGNFTEADKALEGKGKYSEWAFFYNPDHDAKAVNTGKEM
jgi:type II secretory pathway pseudopilin PulG